MVIRQNVMRPAVLAAGYKGTAFVSGLLANGVYPERIVSYQQSGDRSNAFDKLVELSRAHGICFEEARHPRLDADCLVFVVGWQFLLSEVVERCIVFHDSLLPKLRGFSPTISALLSGENVIGVTAFRPIPAVDSGPVYGSRAVRVPPRASLQTVFDLQTTAMIELALEIAERAHLGDLQPCAQDENAATYSLWRDDFDYFIDWRRSAPEIMRQIEFVGFPYDGAKAVFGDRLLVIVKARLGPDINFAIRDPGKLWQIEDSRALVVCGVGTVWIDEALDVDRQPFRFVSLRTRFLTADNAWVAPFVSRR
jgi:methionyl-tRNA formyltransferase